MSRSDGAKAKSFNDLASMGRDHFKNLFKALAGASIAEVIWVAQLFPRYAEEEDNEMLMALVMKIEVESVLKSMQKDKSPGPDGWTVEFFQYFFELIGEEMVGVVEESRCRGVIHEPFNTTFLAIIPKSDAPVSFEEFRPISLCNCIYKIIAKIIAICLKPILSCNISKTQFGFLDGKQIHETIGVAQETMHDIKKSKKKGLIVKIDLSKAYDKISWLYLRLLLIHLGFCIGLINWIMGCITNVYFVVLIKGVASPFFHSQRGLRQGCPLSPLLFLLAAEG